MNHAKQPIPTITKIPTLILLLAAFYGHGSCSSGNPTAYRDSSGDTGIVYQNEAYTLYRDSLVEGERTAKAIIRGIWLALKNANKELVRPYPRGTFPELKSEVPMLNILHTIAVNDFEVNNIDNDHFRVSPDFHHDMFFTRDIAFSSYLGANFLFPEMIKKHLRKCRQLRREVGFITARDHEIPIAAVKEKERVEDLTNLEFFEKYRTHAYARRTDDICWVLGYWEAMKVKAVPGELDWFVQEFEYFDQHFYQPFLDPADGLYRGQSSFIDVGGTGYPEPFNIQHSVMIKALSTNCLYYKAFTIMEEAYAEQGRLEEAQSMQKRAEMLAKAIRKYFKHTDGYYAYFIHEDGSLEPRREQLGMAFLVLFGILGPREYDLAIGNYPQNSFGNPLFWPFYPGEHVYHNNSIWPFANTLFNWAELEASRQKEVLLSTLGTLSRHALQGNFNEVMDYETGGKNELHARQYTWSAAAYLGLIYRMILGLDMAKGQDNRLVLTPVLPEELGNTLAVEGLMVKGTTFDIELSGNGNRVKSVTMDDQLLDSPSFPLDGKSHKVILILDH